MLAGLLIAEKTGVGAIAPGAGPGEEVVSILDTVVDRERLAHLDILFDHPIGRDRLGEFLPEEAVEVDPPTGGNWQWEAASILRFRPSGGLAIATDYSIRLNPALLLQPGQQFWGSPEISVRTDQFRVDRIDLQEEPASQELDRIILRGQVRFNYPVDPATLIQYFRYRDRATGTDASLQLETTYTSQVIGFRTPPLQKTREEREIQFEVDAGLTPAGGNVPLRSRFQEAFVIGSREILKVRSVSGQAAYPESQITIRFSSPVSPDRAREFITVTPEATFVFSSAANEMQLSGNFSPGSTYQLIVREGLPGRDSSTLRETHQARVNLLNLQPSVEFQAPGEFLSASGYRSVGVESVNIGQFELTIDRVYQNNLFSLLQFARWQYDSPQYWRHSSISRALGDQIASETIRVAARPNQPALTRLDLGSYLSDSEPGLYRIGLFHGSSQRGTQKWLLITDLGIVAKRGARELTVWVSSFATLAAAAGAEVTVISDQNQTLARGRADSEGFWTSRGLPSGERDPRPHLVTVRRGADFSFLILDRHGVNLAGLDVSGAQPLAGEFQAYLYGERDLYRPGEALQGVAVVRNRSLGLPPSMPLVLRHRDPRGIEQRTLRLDTGEFGLAEYSIDLPLYARTGTHLLELTVADEVIGRRRFQVEDFVPDRIGVELHPSQEEFRAGEELSFRVQGRYLFGPPAAGLQVEGRVRLEATPFRPAGLSEFTFQNPERNLDAIELLTSEQRLDDSGERAFSIRLPEKVLSPSGLSAVLSGRVQEAGGRGVATARRVAVHPYPYYIGLRRSDDRQVDVGGSIEFQYVTVDPQGQRVASGPLRAELYRDRWHTVLRRTPEGGYRYESNREAVLVESRAVSGGATSGTVRFIPRDFGSYRAVVEDPTGGAAAQVSFYVGGWGHSPWNLQNPGRLEIETDKEEYEAGEEAVVEIKAPFPGKLWLTVEREGLLYSRVFTLTENSARLRIPVRENYLPNVYVTATLVRSASDLTAGGGGRAFGAARIQVNRSVKRLPLEVTAPDEIRPRTTLTIRAKTAPAVRVTVAAVDEGILQLIRQPTPSAFDYFYRNLALGVRTSDIFSLLLPELGPQQGLSDPGGGLGLTEADVLQTGAIRREDVVSFWSGVVDSGTDGDVEIAFEIPEFQGALRIMVLAHGVDRFASQEAVVRVRDPLLLLPTFPRFLSFEERLQLPVSVRNDTGGEAEVTVRMSASGPVQAIGEAVRRLTVPNGAERLLYFHLQTGGAQGQAAIELTAAGNGEQTRASGRFPIRADLPEHTEAQSGPLDSPETVLPGAELQRYRTGTVSRRLQISSLPLLQFSEHLNRLIAFPYGCLEQTVSRAFPLIYLEDIVRAAVPEHFQDMQPAQWIEAAQRRLTTMQLFNGGFAFWPSSEQLEPWGSIYAAHFLVEAQQAGHLVNEALYQGALSFLETEVSGSRSTDANTLEQTVYALYVLARAGRPDLGSMDLIRENQFSQLRPHSRALLGAAYAAVGNEDALSQMHRALEDVEQIERQGGANLNSPIRNRAIMLMAFLDARPQDPRVGALVDRLSRDSGQFSWTTQESGFALMALGRFFRRQAERPPFSGTLYAGERQVGRFSSDGRTFSELPEGPLRIVMDPGYEPGSAFFALHTRGVPADGEFRPQRNGLEIETSYLDRQGRTLALDRVVQGDLVVARIRIRSIAGPFQNIAVQQLLPAGLEVENPRLESAETLPWVQQNLISPDHLDLRDDRVVYFIDLPNQRWQTIYAVLRAVSPGLFRVPPAFAEAMYDPSRVGSGPQRAMEIGAPR
ncbi:MAG TPA: MG2 domain-containing protein [Acidobacteriota bacterium]|nr:MG2 domain-containing protein [Acidobacteriota bacterium]